jgi:erythromycin esterase
MRRTLLLIALLGSIQYSGIAQDFKNLDFEYGVYKAQPRKWAIEGEGENYFARLDSTISKTGKKSLCVTLKKAQVFIFLSIPGQLITGKSIQIEGHFKSLSSDSLQAMLMFHNPNGGKPIASQPNNQNNSEWEIISHQASFPADYSADRLLIALMANGSGRFWFDNVKIKIDGKDYGNAIPDFREPTQEEVKELDKKIIPVQSIELISNSKDLKPLGKILGDAFIIALGENSHGSATIYKFKLKMIKYLVEEKGFSIFALESPIVEADSINDYVINDKGTIEGVVNNLVYPSWQTKEMIDIIQWIHHHNKTAKKKVQFRGFDMQDGTKALIAIESFAKKNDTSLHTKILEIKRWSDELSKGNQQWDQGYQKSEAIRAYLESRNSSDYFGIEVSYLSAIKHYVNVLLQSLSLKYNSAKAKSRDEYMSENIKWLAKNEGGNSKIIISADNTHITKASGKMGSALSKLYGEKYMAVGFTFNNGLYSAYGPEKYYEVHPPYVGTYEYFFSRSSTKNYVFDIRNSTIPILNKSAGFRSIGSRPQETSQFVEINLKKHFDLIVYIKKSKQTTPFK